MHVRMHGRLTTGCMSARAHTVSRLRCWGKTARGEKDMGQHAPGKVESPRQSEGIFDRHEAQRWGHPHCEHGNMLTWKWAQREWIPEQE